MEKLLPASIPKVKKLVFKLFVAINSNSSDSSKNLAKILTIIGLTIQKLNLISLAIFAGSSVKNYSSSGLILSLLRIVRADVLLIQWNYQVYYTIIIIIFILLNFFSKLCYLLQLNYKKC